MAKMNMYEYGVTPEEERQMQDEEMAEYEHDIELFYESMEHPQEKIHDHSAANKKSDLCFKKEDRKYYVGCHANNTAGRKAEAKRRGIKKLQKRARIREARRFNNKIKSVYREFAAAEADIWDMIYSHCC